MINEMQIFDVIIKMVVAVVHILCFDYYIQDNNLASDESDDGLDSLELLDNIHHDCSDFHKLTMAGNFDCVKN